MVKLTNVDGDFPWIVMTGSSVAFIFWDEGLHTIVFEAFG